MERESLEFFQELQLRCYGPFTITSRVDSQSHRAATARGPQQTVNGKNICRYVWKRVTVAWPPVEICAANK